MNAVAPALIADTAMLPGTNDTLASSKSLTPEYARKLMQWYRDTCRTTWHARGDSGDSRLDDQNELCNQQGHRGRWWNVCPVDEELELRGHHLCLGWAGVARYLRSCVSKANIIEQIVGEVKAQIMLLQLSLSLLPLPSLSFAADIFPLH